MSAPEIVLLILALFAFDFVVLLVVGLLTSSGTSQCTPDGCTPDPAFQVHRAVIGAIVYAVAVVLPVVVALLRRRAVLAVVAVQVVAAAVLYVQGSGSLRDAHANLRQICTAPPASVAHECH